MTGSIALALWTWGNCSAAIAEAHVAVACAAVEIQESIGEMPSRADVPRAERATRTGAAALRVRIHPTRGVARETVSRAIETAGGLLRSAGIEVEWHACETGVQCAPSDLGAPEAVVILSTSEMLGPVGRCGTAAPGRIAGRGTAIVSVRCIDEVVRTMTRLHGKSQPLLSAWVSDDIVGAVVAHEIGHLIGLTHSRAGVMRARLDPLDVIAIRRGTFAFTGTQATLMRSTLVQAGAKRTAAVRHAAR